MSALYARKFEEKLRSKDRLSDLMAPPFMDNIIADFDLSEEAEDAICDKLPWEDVLPAHISKHVVHACVMLAQSVASNGLDENRPHHGFTIIVGDEEALKSCGRAGFNPF